MSEAPTTTKQSDSPRPRIGSTSSINPKEDPGEAAGLAVPSPSDYFTDEDDSEEEIEQTTPRRRYSELNPRVHRQDGNFDLCESMYKRRGGLGRNAENKWILRCFTLYGPILCYHEESRIEEVTDPSNPRARLNLLKIETIAEMHSKHKPGLPTEHLLTVNIYSNLGKRKWEMCCTSKEQQVIWYNAINAYDGKVNRSDAHAFQRTLSDDHDDMVMPKVGSNDRLELARPRFNSAGGLTMQEMESVAKAAAKAAISMSEETINIPVQKELTMSSKILLIVVLNAASHWIRNGSEQTYKVTMFFMNAFVLYTMFQSDSSAKPALQGPKARAAKAKKQKLVDPTSNADSPRKKKGAKRLPLGSTIPRDTSQPHSYGLTDPTMFNLRIGPNYKKNKQKAPSGPALYELHTMDFLYGDGPLKHTSDKFIIPNIPGVTDISTGHLHIPPMIIVNTWLPGEEPSLFAKNTDGETYSIPMVFVIKKDTLDQLNDLENASPAVKLWSEWCRKAENDAEFRGRFKCMGMIEDIDATGQCMDYSVPKFIQGYNGKPALVTKSGGFKRYDNYIEFTINVGMWVFPARKGLHALAPRFPEFIVNFGFTIEGRSDDELPEALLGGCRILNLDPDKAMVDGVDV